MHTRMKLLYILIWLIPKDLKLIGLGTARPDYKISAAGFLRALDRIGTVPRTLLSEQNTFAALSQTCAFCNNTG